MSTRTAAADPTAAAPSATGAAARSRPSPSRPWTPALVVLAAFAIAAFAPGVPGFAGRLTLGVFLVAAGTWATTTLDETRVAVTAVATLTIAGVLGPDDVLAPVGEPTVWLLVGAFVLAAAVGRTTIPDRLLSAAAGRARTVGGLFWLLTLAVGATAFVIPSTSGRAALLVPVYGATSAALGDRRISRALSLLLPVVVLLTAVASLLGAGAHLVTVELLAAQGARAPGFVDWAVLGIPTAALSASLACAAILRLFLTTEERRRPLEGSSVTDRTPPAPADRATDRRVLVLLGALVAAWASEPWHGIPAGVSVLVAVGVLVLPRGRVLTGRDAVASVSWNLVGFLLASLVLADALVRTGAADALASGVLGPLADAPWLVVLVAVVVVSVAAHLVVTSRTARSSVLVPVVVPVGLAAGLDPTAIAFLSTAAAGYCITLPASAKPVALFSKLDDAYGPADLRRLSTRLLPAHLVLFTVLAVWVWPALGLGLTPTPVAPRPEPVSATAPAPAGDRSGGSGGSGADRPAVGSGGRWAPEVPAPGGGDAASSALEQEPRRSALAQAPVTPAPVLQTPPAAHGPVPATDVAPTPPPPPADPDHEDDGGGDD